MTVIYKIFYLIKKNIQKKKVLAPRAKIAIETFTRNELAQYEPLVKPDEAVTSDLTEPAKPAMDESTPSFAGFYPHVYIPT